MLAAADDEIFAGEMSPFDRLQIAGHLPIDGERRRLT